MLDMFSEGEHLSHVLQPYCCAPGLLEAATYACQPVLTFRARRRVFVKAKCKYFACITSYRRLCSAPNCSFRRVSASKLETRYHVFLAAVPYLYGTPIMSSSHPRLSAGTIRHNACSSQPRVSAAYTSGAQQTRLHLQARLSAPATTFISCSNHGHLQLHPSPSFITMM